MAPSNAKSGLNIDPTLRPDSRLAFRRQVRQTHGTHGTQGIIFADGDCVLICRWVSSALLDSRVSFGVTGSNATSTTEILAGLFLVWERILPIVI